MVFFEFSKAEIKKINDILFVKERRGAKPGRRTNISDEEMKYPSKFLNYY